jgi:hypothetical protein
MSPLTKAKLQLWPWAGFLLGGAALIVNHQLGSDLTIDNCLAHGAGSVLPIGLLTLALTATGAFLSWRLYRTEGHESAPRRFIALVGTMAASLYGFAILLPMLAALIIPRCYG